MIIIIAVLLFIIALAVAPEIVGALFKLAWYLFCLALVVAAFGALIMAIT